MPSGAKSRARANIAALETLAVLREAGRPATLAEQKILATWSGWGAIPGVFDARDESFAAERARLRELLTDTEYRRAEASILNAHYTDPALVAVIWQAVQRAGFSGGRVLEPVVMRNFGVSRDNKARESRSCERNPGVSHFSSLLNHGLPQGVVVKPASFMSRLASSM